MVATAGNSVVGSPVAANTTVPQYSVVHPPMPLHPPSAARRSGSSVARRERLSAEFMAPKIYRGVERRQGQAGSEKTVGDGRGREGTGEASSGVHVARIASTTSANMTARPSTRDSDVAELAAEGRRLTAPMFACVPPSRIEPCCRKADPIRTCADPTTLRPWTVTSPPTGDAKHAPAPSPAG